MCFKFFSHFWDTQIYFKTFKPPQLSQNNRKVIRKSVTWKTLQGSGTYFFFSNEELNKKEKKKKTKQQPTNRRGWVVFILVSRLFCFSFHIERLPDKCIPNWKPSIYRKLPCLYENNINHILPLYSSFPCKDLHALYKVNVIIPILQTVKLNHRMKWMTSPAIKWHSFTKLRRAVAYHVSRGSSSLQRQSEIKSKYSGTICVCLGADEGIVSRWIPIFMGTQKGLPCHQFCYHWQFRASLPCAVLPPPIFCCICVAKWKRRIYSICCLKTYIFYSNLT